MVGGEEAGTVREEVVVMVGLLVGEEGEELVVEEEVVVGEEAVAGME